MKENQITIIKDDGSEELCDILFTHFDEESNKNYVVFQVISTGECSAMEYVEANDNSGQLMPITDDSAWELIEDLLEEYSERLEDEHDCDCGGNCGGGSCGEECDCQ